MNFAFLNKFERPGSPSIRTMSNIGFSEAHLMTHNSQLPTHNS